MRAWRATLPEPPQQPVVAAIRVADKALRDGWAEAELRAALHDLGPPISGAGLDHWRRRRSNGHAPALALDPEAAEEHHAQALALLDGVARYRAGRRGSQP